MQAMLVFKVEGGFVVAPSGAAPYFDPQKVHVATALAGDARSVAGILVAHFGPQAETPAIDIRASLLRELETIHELVCFATEEDTSAKDEALKQIGDMARAAIAKATGTQEVAL